MKYLLAAILFIVLAGVGFYFVRIQPTHTGQTIKPSPPIQTATIIPSITATGILYCIPSDLEAGISPEGAAGSVYGTLTVKNTSGVPCKIDANKFVTVNYKATNVTVKKQGQAGPNLIVLNPDQTAYSQVRFQNGPQCQSGIQQTSVKLQYDISPTNSILYKSQTGGDAQNIVVCSSINEQTEIDVWSLSSKPISQ